MSDIFLQMSGTDDELHATQKASGLLKIYLYRSYFNNRFVEVNCQGNTNNTGNNGAGKTSLLSLIPIFYGAEPNAVVSREAGKLSFAQYYLPSPSSMIAFEYLHQGQERCVLLYSNASMLYYRFVACSAKELFSSENMRSHEEFKDTREWLKSYIAKKYNTSLQLNSTLDYRTIIQNGRRRLSKNRQQNIAISRDFSLCMPQDEMQHMGALTSIMIRNSRMLEQLRIMLVDCYLDNSIHIEVPVVDEQSVQSHTLRAILEVKKKEPQLRASLELKSKLSEVLGKILSCYKFINTYKDKVEARVTKLQALIKDQEDELNTLKDDYEQKHSDLSLQKNIKERLISSHQNRLDTLQQKRNHYDEQNINELIARYEDLASYKDREHTLKEHYDNIKASQEKLIEDFNSRLLILTNKHHNNCKKINESLSSCKQKLNELKVELNEYKNQERSKNEKEREQRLYERSLEKQELNDKILEISLQIEASKLPTEEEAQKSLAYEKQIEALNSEQEKRQSDFISVTKALHEQDEKLAILKQNLDKLKEEIARLISKIDLLKEQLYPQEGSLQAFLEDINPKWREHLGKIINPSLLSRVDLKPEYSSSDDSFYGITLDYEAIETPSYLLKATELERLRDEAMLQLEKLQRDKKRDIESFYKEQKEQQILQAKVQRLSSDIEKAQKEISAQKNLYETYKAEIKRNAQKRCDKLLDNLVAYKKHLSVFDANTEQMLSDIKQRYLDRCNELAASYAQKQDPILEYEKQKQAQLDTENSDYQVQKKQLESAQDAALKEKGLDPLVVRQAKEVYMQASLDVEEIEKSQQLILDYKDWEKSEWVLFDELTSELYQSQGDVEKLNNDLRCLDNEYKRQSDLKKLSLKGQRHDLNSANDEYRELEQCLKLTLASEISSNLYDDVDEVVIEPIEIAYELTHLAQDLIKEAHEYGKELEDAISKVDKILQLQSQDNVISKSWNELLSIRKENYKGDIYSQAFVISCIDDLQKLLDEIIPLHEQTVIESVRSASQSFMNFYVSLQTFNSRVAHLSKEFGKKVSLDNPFTSLSDIQIELLSKVEEQDLWLPLANFSKLYQDYFENYSSPSYEFLNAFEKTNDALRSCHISANLESLVSLKVSLRENGRLVQIRSDNDLSGLSSRGISKLAIIVIFCGLTRYLCKDNNIRIHWPLDELGELHEENVVLLFELMNRNNIVLFCAQPNPSPSLLQYFDTNNYIDKNEGVKLCVDAEFSANNPLIKKVL